jgi:thioredoxin 1
MGALAQLVGAELDAELERRADWAPLFCCWRIVEEPPIVRTRTNRPLMLFFTRETSGPARRMESLIAHFARKERRHLRVVCVDMDENSELAEKLRVGEAPTIVLLKERRPVDRLEGRATGLQIEEMIRAHVA